MIIFNRQSFHTGGKTQIPVWRVCADSVEEHDRLVAALGTVDKGHWWGSWPTARDVWDYKDKRQPSVSVRREVLDVLIHQAGAFEVPQEQWWFTLVLLRRDFWRELTEHDKRDIDGKGEEFFRRKLRWAAGQVLKRGVDPDLYAPRVWCDPKRLIPGLNLIKSRVENFDPGHQNRLNPRTTEEEEDLPESIREYLRMSEMDRREYLSKKPWVVPTLIGRGFEAEIPADLR